MDTLTSHLQALVLAAIREAVPQAVHDALVAALPAVVRRAALPPYLTRAELAELTGWSVRKIDHLRQRGRLPYVKIGQAVRFKADDVDRFLDEARVEARRAAPPRAP